MLRRALIAAALLAVSVPGCKKAGSSPYASIVKDDGEPLDQDVTYWEWAASDQAPQDMKNEEQALIDEEKRDEPGINDDSPADTTPSTDTAAAVALRLVDYPDGANDAGTPSAGTGADASGGLTKAADDPDANAAEDDSVIAETFVVTEGDIVDDNAPLDDGSASGELSLKDRSHGLALANVFRRTWPGGNIPYVFAPGFAAQNQATQAMQAWMDAVPAVHFKAQQNEQGYIYITSASPGCFATLGYTGRRQVVNLGKGCLQNGTIMHELGHALGLHHEQKRSDASVYIKINYANIMPDKVSQFTSAGAVDGPYDYGSVMHYGAYAFSKNGQRTIEPTQAGAKIGQRWDPLESTCRHASLSIL